MTGLCIKFTVLHNAEGNCDVSESSCILIRPISNKDVEKTNTAALFDGAPYQRFWSGNGEDHR